MSDSMTIAGFKVYTVEMPMRFSVSHSLAERKVARNILVCAVGDDGLKGWGECCPRPYVTGETVESVKRELSGNLLPIFKGASFNSMGDVSDAIGSVVGKIERNQQCAFCAMELAILDLGGKVFGVSAGQVIGPVIRDKIRYSGVIAADSPKKAKKYALMMRFFGFRDVKVKVYKSLGVNIKILEAVRNILGSKVSLRIDANGAWDSDDSISQLEAMRRFGICGVEQPVAGGDFQGMATVTAAKIVPVIADESICSVSDAKLLLDKKGCDVFNIRISKCGGLINSFKIYQMAVKAGIGCQLGAQVGESGVLSAAGRHFGTRCKGIRWFEGSYGRFLLKKGICRPTMTLGYGGKAGAIKAAGLGVDVKKKLLDSSKSDCFEKF